MTLYPSLQEHVHQALAMKISQERMDVLDPLIQYIQGKINMSADINLNFICTHNSRRSQFSQIWAQAAADFHDIPVNSFSGGVEVTAFNERAVASIKRFGFEVKKPDNSANPHYQVKAGESGTTLVCFSKLFDDPVNRADKFAAVMTCSHADENCPFIPGTEQRIAVRYEDPKAFDDTPEESERYDQRSKQIASEMFYVFGQLKK